MSSAYMCIFSQAYMTDVLCTIRLIPVYFMLARYVCNKACFHDIGATVKCKNACTYQIMNLVTLNVCIHRPLARNFCWGVLLKESELFSTSPNYSPGAIKEFISCVHSPHSWGFINIQCIYVYIYLCKNTFGVKKCGQVK